MASTATRRACSPHRHRAGGTAWCSTQRGVRLLERAWRCSVAASRGARTGCSNSSARSGTVRREHPAGPRPARPTRGHAPRRRDRAPARPLPIPFDVTPSPSIIPSRPGRRGGRRRGRPVRPWSQCRCVQRRQPPCAARTRRRVRSTAGNARRRRRARRRSAGRSDPLSRVPTAARARARCSPRRSTRATASARLRSNASRARKLETWQSPDRRQGRIRVRPVIAQAVQEATVRSRVASRWPVVVRPPHGCRE